jgi:hypothetical protein
VRYREDVGLGRCRVVKYRYFFQVGDLFDILQLRETSLAGDVANDAEVDGYIVQCRVGIFHHKYAGASDRQVFTELLVLPLPGQIDLEVRPEETRFDKAKIALDRNAAVTPRRGLQDHQAQQQCPMTGPASE